MGLTESRIPWSDWIDVARLAGGEPATYHFEGEGSCTTAADTTQRQPGTKKRLQHIEPGRQAVANV